MSNPELVEGVSKGREKVIIVGSSSGIGRATAKVYAKNGYNVGIAARKIDQLESLKKEINEESPNINVCIKQLDVTQEQNSRDAIFSLIEDLGGLDIMIVSVSCYRDLNDRLGAEKEYPTKDSYLIMDVDLYGFWNVAEVAVNFFNRQKYGHLVGISSVDAVRGNAQCPEYSGAKSFMATYLEGVRNYFVQNKIPIYVTEIRPGWVDVGVDHGPDSYWVAPVDKVAKQIFNAVKYKKKVAYVTKRWRLFAWLMQILPDCIYNASWWKIR